MAALAVQHVGTHDDNGVPETDAQHMASSNGHRRGALDPGGVFSGPVLNGTVDHTSVKGRYDAPGRCIHILARAKMITDDGVVIYKTDRSRWLGRDDAIDRLVNGEEVADCEYYLVGVIEYSVSDPSYAWLEKGQYLSRGLVDGDLLHVAQFRAISSL